MNNDGNRNNGRRRPSRGSSGGGRRSGSSSGGNRQGGGGGGGGGGRRPDRRGDRSGSRANGRTGGGRPRGRGPSRPSFEVDDRIRDFEEQEVEGLLELTPEGFGFLRKIERNFEISQDDIFVPTGAVKRFRLREGSMIRGLAGPPRGRGTNPSLERIDEVDGIDPDLAMERLHYKSLTSIDPTARFVCEDDDADISLRVLDLLCPIGRGQRGLIVAPPRTGKTVLLQKLAKRIEAGYPDVHLIILLIDERPEEATDFSRCVTNGEVIYSTNDEPASHSIRVAELAIERAKRLLESGKDVFVLMDSLTRLGRAYNIEVKNSGRTLSGGVDAKTLERPKAFFGAARKAEGGGSLTILATALVETGSRMDDVIFEEFKGTGNMELVLSRQLAERRIWPAIDINKSGTRREERMVDEATLERMWMLRRVLNTMNPVEGMELLQRRLKETSSNEEFLAKFTVPAS